MGFPLTPSQWTRTGVTLGAGLAGALINLKPFPILHGVDVVFGSILALAPAILYGPFHGGIAAALSFLPGLTQGHHTFALVLGIGQAMALGWRLRRNREAVVETDLLYWFLVGLPLILAFCLFVSGYSLALTITILGIQIVLGVGTAVSCSLWLRVSGVEGRLNPRVSLHWPMKTYLAHTVALMMLTPIAVGIVGFGEWYRSFTWHQLNMDTVSFGRSSLARAEMLTDRYMEEIASLAYAASDSMTSLAKLDRRISLTRASNDDFLSVAIVDAEGQIVASSPLADADEDNVPDWRTEDPTLLRQARQAEGVFLTALARCSITGRISTLTVAPIRDAEGRFLGYARAAVSLDRIAENMLAEPTAHHSFMAVLDEQGRAIVSNIPFLKQTQSLDVAVLGRLEPGEDGAFLIVPTPESPLDGEAVLWRQHDPRSGWETVIIHPLDDHLESLHTAYATLMAGAVLMLCAMVVINRRWTGKVTASLENLAVLVDTSPDQLGHEDWRFNSGVTEVNTLADALGRDVAQRRRTEAALAGHNAILSMVAHGAALPGVLRAVAHQVETEIPGARCAVFLLEQDAQRLRPFASPSLPEAYARSLDGALLAEAPAFVRVACRLGRPRSSETLSGNSQWPIHRQLAEEHGFMACCAVPMQGSGNMLLG
ncbi:MAG TPA: cache domain-containing protein, partial [Symbiobacteriaceae bacterium]|nr:cache domain-containing protein [Symbiobacteriaceae bacterium]